MAMTIRFKRGWPDNIQRCVKIFARIPQSILTIVIFIHYFIVYLLGIVNLYDVHAILLYYISVSLKRDVLEMNLGWRTRVMLIHLATWKSNVV